MTAFIDEHHDVYGVELICKVLPIAPSTYYQHAARKADPDLRPIRARRDEALGTEIRRVWDENRQVYGARKVWQQLRREDLDVARCTVERRMRRLGLRGVIRGRAVKTTVSDKATPCPLDKINRQPARRFGST
ncbi:MAG: IS3 family transposase [Xanthomonadales bacterium]|jgi:putative transposase|nr:IS3 family transposase [Xanthomonadales bacterium]MBN8794374.1 IS3 family transposase [Stenotrophomonas nitritireducens]